MRKISVENLLNSHSAPVEDLEHTAIALEHVADSVIKLSSGGVASTSIDKTLKSLMGDKTYSCEGHRVSTESMVIGVIIAAAVAALALILKKFFLDKNSRGSFANIEKTISENKSEAEPAAKEASQSPAFVKHEVPVQQSDDKPTVSHDDKPSSTDDDDAAEKIRLKERVSKRLKRDGRLPFYYRTYGSMPKLGAALKLLSEHVGSLLTSVKHQCDKLAQTSAPDDDLLNSVVDTLQLESVPLIAFYSQLSGDDLPPTSSADKLLTSREYMYSRSGTTRSPTAAEWNKLLNSYVDDYTEYSRLILQTADNCKDMQNDIDRCRTIMEKLPHAPEAVNAVQSIRDYISLITKLLGDIQQFGVCHADVSEILAK